MLALRSGQWQSCSYDFFFGKREFCAFLFLVKARGCHFCLITFKKRDENESSAGITVNRCYNVRGTCFVDVVMVDGQKEKYRTLIFIYLFIYSNIIVGKLLR